MIRALLTKIRKSNPNILTSERYGELTGNKPDLQEFIWNSKELASDTEQDGYLDQVITLFLLFVRDILGLEGQEVGGQRDSDKTEQALDLLSIVYGSTGYSKQDDDNRKAFVTEVIQKLKPILEESIKKLRPEENKGEPYISFEINQKQLYYLAELADAFYQFMSAEMDKSKTGDGALNETKSKAAQTIQSHEKFNLYYLRRWFFRTRSIHPIITCLYKGYLNQKIDFMVCIHNMGGRVAFNSTYYGYRVAEDSIG
jgi:hypothetical protein